MYLTDYHTHTRCSPDSEASLADMARAAQNAGLRELCTTDHCDLQQEDGSLLGDWDWDPVLAQFEEAELTRTGPTSGCFWGWSWEVRRPIPSGRRRSSPGPPWTSSSALSII